MSDLIERLTAKASEVKHATCRYTRTSDIEQYVSAFNLLLLDKAHTEVGVIWSSAVFECSVLAEASYFLAIHGFYEEASSLLRGILEGFLTRLYWDIRNNRNQIRRWVDHGKSTNEYWEWESGDAATYPNLAREVWPRLLEEPGISHFEREFGLKESALSILAVLDRFVHGRPASRHYGGAFRGSTLNVEFKPNHLAEWLHNLRGVYTVILTLSFLQYPTLYGMDTASRFRTLEPEQAARVQVVLAAGSAGAA